MTQGILKGLACASLILCLSFGVFADRRDDIFRFGQDLEEAASDLAQDSFEYFKGRDGAISDQEQAALFKSEAFAASCRLFLRLMEEKTGYFSASYLRTNLFSAYSYLVQSFRDLETEMRRGGLRTYTLSDCGRILDRMEDAFAQWPSAENLAYLEQRYVKARDDTVYLIEKQRSGRYVRRPFRNLESLYRYNYDRNREGIPWDFLVEVSYDILNKIEEGRMIDLTFEGQLVIEQSQRPNRGVYLIENGKKRGLTSPQVLQRFGGWGKVLEIPAEIINGYPDGEPIR